MGTLRGGLVLDLHNTGDLFSATGIEPGVRGCVRRDVSRTMQRVIVVRLLHHADAVADRHAMLGQSMECIEFACIPTDSQRITVRDASRKTFPFLDGDGGPGGSDWDVVREGLGEGIK